MIRLASPRSRSAFGFPSNAGFSLVEMAIAIAVIAVTFMGIIGLLGVGLETGQASTQQTVGTNIADAIIADLRSTPNFATTSVRYGLTLPTPPTTPNTSLTPLAGLTPAILYFDINGNFISPINASPAPTNAVFAARVYDAAIVSVGPASSTSLAQTMDLVRVVVTWPAAAAVPTGSLEVISQVRIH